MSHGHPILPRKPGSKDPLPSRPPASPTDGPTPTWHRFLSKDARERLAADDITEHTAERGREGSTEIDRLRDMLSRRTPKDVDYQDIAQQLARAYADAFPGSEVDNAR
jgi:hypothetical protein